MENEVDLPAHEVERRRTARVVRKITSRTQQDEDTLHYWQSRTAIERLETAFAMTRAAYIAKGYDADTLGRSERLVTRIQRAWG